MRVDGRSGSLILSPIAQYALARRMPLIWLLSVTLGFGVQTSCPSAASQAAKERYARGDSSGAIAALADVEICTDGSEVELAEALRWRAQAKAAAGDSAGSIE